jgi:hypothetical protein
LKIDVKDRILQNYTYALCQILLCDERYTGLYPGKGWFRAVPANDMQSIDLENYTKINLVAVAH